MFPIGRVDCRLPAYRWQTGLRQPPLGGEKAERAMRRGHAPLGKRSPWKL